MKKISTKNIFKLSVILFSYFFIFNFANAESVVYLKNPSGQLVGKITYEKSFVNEYIKINSFCVYKNVTEGISCEYLDDSSPLAQNPDAAVRDVGAQYVAETNNLWNAIGGVSKRLNNFIPNSNDVISVSYINSHFTNIDVYVFQGNVEGNITFITAGVHGDETSGIHIAYNTIDQLRKCKIRSGTIIVIPQVNP
jgi:hypothetical protein